jgi:hypothetical protein
MSFFALALSLACSILPRGADAQSIGFKNITGQTTTLVKPGAGKLHQVCFNTPAATEVVTIFDSLTAAGTKIATITVQASPQSGCLRYDVNFSVGLTVLTATASSDITVTFE